MTTDLVLAMSSAIVARDLRRCWKGDAAEAVAVSCAAAGLLGDHEAVVRFGTLPPLGEARPDELTDDVLGMVAFSASLLGQHDIAAHAGAQVKAPFLATVSAAEVALGTGDATAEAKFGQAWDLASTPE